MGMDVARARKPSRLLNLGNLDAPIDLDEVSRRIRKHTRCGDVQKLEKDFNFLQEKLSGLSEKDAQDRLIALRSDQRFNETASGGFLYGILVDPANAATVR